MSQSFTRRARNVSGPDGVLLALRVTSVLACLTVLYRAATAGPIFTRDEVAGDLPAAGTILLCAFTGLAVVAALVHRRVAAAPWWPTAVAAVVFTSSSGQALVGQRPALYVDLALDLALMVGATVVATWALTARPGPVAR